VPLLKTHGEGGHIVNTASMAGFLSGTGFGADTASKFAVVGISEALATELEPQGIGVSILCPGWVATCISESRRNWPKEYDAPPPKGPLSEQFAELIRNGMAPSYVAELVLKGIKDNELYIFTHAEMRPWLEKRETMSQHCYWVNSYAGSLASFSESSLLLAPSSGSVMA
jgi:short-subunit dehydrogenase